MVAFNTANTEGINFGTVYTVSASDPSYPGIPFGLGTVVKGSDGSEWVFIKAATALAVGDVVIIDSATFFGSEITSTLGTFGNLVAVAPLTAFTSGQYGWVQRAGRCAAINVKAACLPNAQLATTATPGIIDDAVTSGGKRLNGIIINASNSAATAAAKAGTLNYPIVYTTY